MKRKIVIALCPAMTILMQMKKKHSKRFLMKQILDKWYANSVIN